MKTLSFEEVKYFTDKEILNSLEESWELEKNEGLSVWGFLDVSTNFKTDKNFYTLKNIKTKEKLNIEYPLENIEDKQTIKNKGIYVPFVVGERLLAQQKYNENIMLSCILHLANENMRERNNNPMLLEVDEKSIKVLQAVPKDLEIMDDDTHLYVEKNIFNAIIKSLNKEITEKKQEISKERLKLLEVENKNKNDLDILVLQNEKEKIQLTDLKKKIKEDITSLKTKHKEQIEKIDNKKEKEEEKLKDLKQNKIKVTQEIKMKKENIVSLDTKIKELKTILKEEVDIMGKKLEKLRTYIKVKVNILLDLEFIDKEEYNNLMMINEEASSEEVFIDFEKDLKLDKQQAISHIQAYLFEKDIIYPRYILEDFFALLQTNDLIILAGESGSGKTNLIKSFADAIGGKSFIIPVKPNWTSSEDLLGYYNPLEKKYLATPFLEALLEAKDNPNIPYFICLDEMNLARVEYYFADFLSLLEERGEQPEIKLYSEDESSHILSEFKNVIKVIEDVKEKYKKNNIVNFIELLQDEEINKELTRIFGFSDKDSLIKYHTDLRRMISGILNTPSSITFPKNVRIIGAINIDETTHYLSPKILDRAHIMKFGSPLLQDWDKIANEIEDVPNKELRIKFKIEDIGSREPYPSYHRDNEFCKIVTYLTREFFTPLGIEVGLRTIRQGLNYQQIWLWQNSEEELLLNNFILHKILPKMTFDGNKQVRGKLKIDILENLRFKLEDKYITLDIAKKQNINVLFELKNIIKTSKENDDIVNYWA